MNPATIAVLERMAAEHVAEHGIVLPPGVERPTDNCPECGSEERFQTFAGPRCGGCNHFFGGTDG